MQLKIDTRKILKRIFLVSKCVMIWTFPLIHYFYFEVVMLILSAAYNSDVFSTSYDFQATSLEELLGAREDFIDTDLYDRIADADAKFLQTGEEGFLDGLAEAISNFFSGLFEAISRFIESIFGGGSSGGGSSSGTVTGNIKNPKLDKATPLRKRIDDLIKEDPSTKITLPRPIVEKSDFSRLVAIQKDLITMEKLLCDFVNSGKIPNNEQITQLCTIVDWKGLHQAEATAKTFKNDTFTDFIKDIDSNLSEKQIFTEIVNKLNKGGLAKNDIHGILFLKVIPKDSQIGCQEALDYAHEILKIDTDPSQINEDRKLTKDLKEIEKKVNSWITNLKSGHKKNYNEGNINYDINAWLDGEDPKQFNSRKGGFNKKKARSELTNRIGKIRNKYASVLMNYIKLFRIFKPVKTALGYWKQGSYNAIELAFNNYFKDKNKSGQATESMVSIYRKLGGE